HTNPILTQTKGKHLSVGILFKPWGLYQIFGISPAALTNTAIDTQIIGNKLMKEFVHEQTENISLDSFLPSFENFMLQHFKPKEIKQEVIQTIHTIQSSQIQKGTMGKIAGELKISPKTFIHYFNQTVGVSPIQYLHLLQVNQAIQLITKCPTKSLTDIGLQVGFYDQSHFIKTFKKFCNLSPNAFRNNSRKQVNSVQFGLFTHPYFC
ncbi:MAG: helix-turn-helix domain-containing protein, partial [Bacteroidota bacterium]